MAWIITFLIENSFPKNSEPVIGKNCLVEYNRACLLSLSLSLSPTSGYSTLFFINNLKGKTYLPNLQIKMLREIYNGTNDRNNVWNDRARTNGSKRIWHLIEIHMYLHLNSKIKYTSRKEGTSALIAYHTKNIFFISINPQIIICWQVDRLLKS